MRCIKQHNEGVNKDFQNSKAGAFTKLKTKWLLFPLLFIHIIKIYSQQLVLDSFTDFEVHKLGIIPNSAN